MKKFLKLKEDYEQELTHFEGVGRKKSEEEEEEEEEEEKEMDRSQKIKKIIFHLNKIRQVSSENKITFP